MKGNLLRAKIIFVSAACMLAVLAGCQPARTTTGQLFTVDFKPDIPLRYKFVSQRSLAVNLRSGSKSSGQNMSETLELLIDYSLTGGDEYGLSTITATCRSAKVTRKGFTGGSADAVKELAGKSYSFQIAPTGKIAEYSEIESLVQALGEKAFTTSERQGRIKAQEMIHDFIAVQWYLWDAVAGIEEPLNGVEVGQSWASQQFIPTSMPITAIRHPVRETTYTLSEITETETGPKAVIDSSYALTELEADVWPKPYGGKYRMRGMLGFLRNYDFLTLDGSGKQTIDLESGVVESFEQQYKVSMKAAFLLPLGGTAPHVTMNQKITAQLLDN